MSQATAWPLLVLRVHGVPLRQGVLADEIGVEGASLVRVIDALETAGLIERLADPEDRRARCVTLSAAGQAKAADIAHIVDRVRADVVNGIDPAELRIAERVLRAIQQRLETLNTSDSQA
ncbi:MarR family transcriptional regulator [Bordetella holmesii]|nr:transcriptional regulator [Bordetella holmesii]AUL24104.1 transcriptional regulator [Bordetella holmesii]AUL27431.1 transcriptional regulator [Bordetella holmesii]AUL30776.1 transcriptional regulator [Bordetella holmesii]AUL34102.1 transcriptional regulator [Bordetella holmesii]